MSFKYRRKVYNNRKRSKNKSFENLMVYFYLQYFTIKVQRKKNKKIVATHTLFRELEEAKSNRYLNRKSTYRSRNKCGRFSSETIRHK